MVCRVCHDMLYGHKGRKDSGSQLQLNFKHHARAKNLRDPATQTSCYLCRVIQERLEKLKINIDGDDRGEFLPASLSPSRRRRMTGLYHLDFRIEKKDLLVASFVLKQNGKADDPLLNKLKRELQPDTSKIPRALPMSMQNQSAKTHQIQK